MASSCLRVFNPSEIVWAREKVTELNSLIRSTAEQTGVTFVDVIRADQGDGFAGHELCTSNPLLGFNLHPTAEGQKVIARLIGLQVMANPDVSVETTPDPAIDTSTWRLGDDGFGPVRLGDETVLAGEPLVRVFGRAPEVFEVYGCENTIIGRELAWDGLSLYVNLSDVVAGYMYTGGDLYLETSTGVAIGDSWSSLRLAYPRVQDFLDSEQAFWLWNPSGSYADYSGDLRGFLDYDNEVGFFWFGEPAPPIEETWVAAIMSGSIFERQIFFC